MFAESKALQLSFISCRKKIRYSGSHLAYGGGFF